MDKKKKVQRAHESMLKLLAEMGADTKVIEELKESAPIHVTDLQKSLEAEGILLTLLSDRQSIRVKTCKREECKQTFGTNYAYVGYCSDNCRSKELERVAGIRWNPLKPQQERWGSEVYPSQIPIVISPEAIQNLLRLAEQIRELQSVKENSPASSLELPERKKTHSVLNQKALGEAIDFVYSSDPLYREIRDSMGIPGYTPPTAQDAEIHQPPTMEDYTIRPVEPQQHKTPEQRPVKSVFRTV